jgi:alpha-1,2-mannosyltransferase
MSRWRRQWEIWAVLGAVAFAIVAVLMFGRRYTFFDMKIYHGAVEWWVHGGPLYEFIAPNTTLGFTYPPFAALTMLPMATMSATAAGWVNIVASVAALTLVLAALLFPIADRWGWPRWPTLGVALPLALALEPGRETLGFGQVNLLLFALVFADLVALRWRASGGLRRMPRAAAHPSNARGDLLSLLRERSAGLSRLWFSGAWAGVGIGLATAVKVTPGLFLLYLVLARQWRAALVATCTAGAATLFGWLVAPRESFVYFTHALWQTDRVGAADFTPNQALSGLLARLYDSPESPGLVWLTFAALCAALGLSRAITAHKEGDELTAFTLVGITSTVISPISWSHHLVFVIPALIVLVDVAMRRRAAARRLHPQVSLAGLRHGAAALGTYLLFVMAPIWWVHHRLPETSHYDSGIYGLLAENSLALGGILLVALLPWRPGADPAPNVSGVDHRLRYLIRTRA